MSVPLKYNFRHLRLRWSSTVLTVLSIALVVAVFILVLALARGLRSTFLNTSDARNLIVLRKGALAESSSQITIEDVRRTRELGGIRRTERDEPLASAEVIVLITLDRKSGGQAHVQVRGLGPLGLRLRPQLHLAEGRMFQAGVRECIVSRKVAQRFAHCGLGEQFRSGKDSWQVVGLFDAAKSAYESEIWMDADEARESFRRSFYCSMTLQPENPDAATALIQRIESDKAGQLRAITEAEYFQAQTKMAGPIQMLGICLAVVMSLGAAFSAMNTMYATVDARTREIGTLRVLGFEPHAIALSFLGESLMLSLVGGILGCLLSLPLHGVATGSFNWSTFAEVAFEFQITPGLLAFGMLFAFAIGAVGGLLPARLAARKPLLEALRSV